MALNAIKVLNVIKFGPKYYKGPKRNKLMAVTINGL